MLIIVEGPDCAGKSSFIKLLRETFNDRFANEQEHFTLLHAGPPTKDPIDEYITPLLDYRPGNGQHIICDRWHWGEAVYPIVFNRSSKMTHNIFIAIESFLRHCGAIVVYITASRVVITERLIERGDDLVKPCHAAPMLLGFIDVVDFYTSLEVISYDTSLMHPGYSEAEHVLLRAMETESDYI